MSIDPACGPAPSRAGVLGALALAAEVADQLVVSTSRDVHDAWVARTYTAVGRLSSASAPVRRAHELVARVAYGGVSTGLRGLSGVLRVADRQGLGPRVEDSPGGRSVVAAANALMGDRLRAQRPDLAITLSVRSGGADVAVEPDALRAAFPRATGDLAVFLHGLGESEEAWRGRGGAVGGGYAGRLAAETAWTPVLLRANTGLTVTDNGVALAALLDGLVTAWPTEVRRVALIGHSMGGLVVRAACAVAADAPSRWTERVTDVVTLGTPHLGAPLERAVHGGARALGLLPESAPFGRILEFRSPGILDLRSGLAPDLQHLPHARYRLVAATVAGPHRHPAGQVLGDLMVGYPSATGRPRRGRALFPDADVLHVRGHHLDLLDHPEVDAAIRSWLA